MYLTVFILLFFFILIEHYDLIPKSNRSVLYILTFLLLVCHDGLRWEMATDFFPYYDHFNYFTFENNEYKGFEYLYNLLVYGVKSLFGSYTFFLLIHAIIIYFLYIYSLKKYTLYPFIAILFIYVSLIGVLGSNRQNIALAICFFSIRFIVEKRYIYFLLAIIIAIGFHKTSIIFLIVVFLNREFNYKMISVVLISVAILSFLSYFQTIFQNVTMVYLPSLFEEKAEAYLLSNDEFGNSIVGTIFGLIRKSVPLFFLLRFKCKLKQNNYYNLVFNLLLVSLLMYIAFNNNLQFLVGRLTSYFSIFECIALSWLFVALRKEKINFLYLLIFMCYSVLLFFRSIAIYPELFLPYKSIFSR